MHRPQVDINEVQQPGYIGASLRGHNLYTPEEPTTNFYDNYCEEYDVSYRALQRLCELTLRFTATLHDH